MYVFRNGYYTEEAAQLALICLAQKLRFPGKLKRLYSIQYDVFPSSFVMIVVGEKIISGL